MMFGEQELLAAFIKARTLEDKIRVFDEQTFSFKQNYPCSTIHSRQDLDHGRATSYRYVTIFFKEHNIIIDIQENARLFLG